LDFGQYARRVAYCPKTFLSPKNGKENYISGNVLIEMGQAFVNDKKIFLTNSIPTDSPYADEIISMDPIYLEGKLENIKKYV